MWEVRGLGGWALEAAPGAGRRRNTEPQASESAGVLACLMKASALLDGNHVNTC